jgi:hypothetical protein
MVGGLIEANLARHPERVRLLRPAVIDLSAPDAAVSVTLSIEPGRIRVSSGDHPSVRSHVHVRAPAEDLLLLASVPLRFGLPDPLRRGGRTVLARVIRGRIRIQGLVRHPSTLSRLSRLLSVV